MSTDPRPVNFNANNFTVGSNDLHSVQNVIVQIIFLFLFYTSLLARFYSKFCLSQSQTEILFTYFIIVFTLSLKLNCVYFRSILHITML